MADIAELRARLASLRDNRASPAREVQNADERVVFKSDEEFAAAIADVERQIAEAEGRSTPRFVNIVNTRGW